MDFEQKSGEMVNDSYESKVDFIDEISNWVEKSGYNVVELNSDKPWGGYIRINNNQADKFVEQFFPDVSPEEARLGVDVELSPKILIVSPDQRLSWQYHDRRSERWVFLTDGSYSKSDTDEEGEPIEVTPGYVVQFETGDRHRLNGIPDKYVVVAEIWQHTDPDSPSDENDIVRLADDYSR